MESNDRDYIHGVARKEEQIRSLEEGDHVTVKARYGEYAGYVEDVNAADPGEGNYVVMVDAKVFNADAMDADTHTLVIDYEGAFESEYAYYCPYVVATADSRSLQEVGQLHVEKDAPEVRQ